MSEIVEEVPKAANEVVGAVFKVTPRDVLMVTVGFGLGFTFKHYRNVYLEWKRKKLVSPRQLSKLLQDTNAIILVGIIGKSKSRPW